MPTCPWPPLELLVHGNERLCFYALPNANVPMMPPATPNACSSIATGIASLPREATSLSTCGRRTGSETRDYFSCRRREPSSYVVRLHAGPPRRLASSSFRRAPWRSAAPRTPYSQALSGTQTQRRWQRNAPSHRKIYEEAEEVQLQ